MLSCHLFSQVFVVLNESPRWWLRGQTTWKFSLSFKSMFFDRLFHFTELKVALIDLLHNFDQFFFRHLSFA